MGCVSVWFPFAVTGRVTTSLSTIMVRGGGGGAVLFRDKRLNRCSAASQLWLGDGAYNNTFTSNEVGSWLDAGSDASVRLWRRLESLIVDAVLTNVCRATRQGNLVSNNTVANHIWLGGLATVRTRRLRRGCSRDVRGPPTRIILSLITTSPTPAWSCPATSWCAAPLACSRSAFAHLPTHHPSGQRRRVQRRLRHLLGHVHVQHAQEGACRNRRASRRAR